MTTLGQFPAGHFPPRAIFHPGRITFLNPLQLCNFKEICGVSFIITYYMYIPPTHHFHNEGCKEPPKHSSNSPLPQ